MSRLCRFGFFLISVIWFIAPPASAATLIRDAEIEAGLRTLTAPILKAAGLDADRVRLYVVQDGAINAFVAGGENIFLHTGLILACRTPEMLQGVVAHEAGHIAGGHLARGGEQRRGALMSLAVTSVLGGLAAASGSGEAGIALLSAGQQLALGQTLRFTRANEEAADQAAMRFLDSAHVPASGMVEMLELLRNQDTMRGGTVGSPYLRSHPLSSERIANLRDHATTSRHASSPATSALHARLLAKLRGFLGDPTETLRRYPASDTGDAATYARAIAFFRRAELSKALTLMDTLLKRHPTDAYLHDTLGQILFESAKVVDAQAAYAKAHALAPGNALISAELGKTLVAREIPALLPEAIRYLETATVRDKTLADGWYWLGVAYGRQGNPARSHLALAEHALLARRFDEARTHAGEAKRLLPKDSPGWLRADDQMRAAADAEREEKKGL